MKRFLQNIRWAVLWGLFLVILHTLPGRVFPVIPTFIDLLTPDKLVHVVMFAVFVVLMIRAFVKEGSPETVRTYPVLSAFACALLFGAVMELVQNYLITNRYGSVYDEVANFAGCLIGWLTWALFRNRR